MNQPEEHVEQTSDREHEQNRPGEDKVPEVLGMSPDDSRARSEKQAEWTRTTVQYTFTVMRRTLQHGKDIGSLRKVLNTFKFTRCLLKAACLKLSLHFMQW